MTRIVLAKKTHCVCVYRVSFDRLVALGIVCCPRRIQQQQRWMNNALMTCFHVPITRESFHVRMSSFLESFANYGSRLTQHPPCHHMSYFFHQDKEWRTSDISMAWLERFRRTVSKHLPVRLSMLAHSIVSINDRDSRYHIEQFENEKMVESEIPEVYHECFLTSKIEFVRSGRIDRCSFYTVSLWQHNGCLQQQSYISILFRTCFDNVH